jgi:hypothetical protein
VYTLESQAVATVTGELVPTATGGEVPTVTGGAVPTATGGEVPTATGGEVPTATGGEVPTATGGAVPTATGGVVPTPTLTGGVVPAVGGVPNETDFTVEAGVGGGVPRLPPIPKPRRLRRSAVRKLLDASALNRSSDNNNDTVVILCSMVRSFVRSRSLDDDDDGFDALFPNQRLRYSSLFVASRF